MWQTPVSSVSPWNSTPLASSSLRVSCNVGHAQREPGGVRALEARADRLHAQEVDADVLAELILGKAALVDGR